MCEEIFMNEFDVCMMCVNGMVFVLYEKKIEEERVDELS